MQVTNMTSLDRSAEQYLRRVIDTLTRLDRQTIGQVARALLNVREREGTVYVFGNGGSGATASHMYCDLTKGVSHGHRKRFRVVCLNDNTPAMMAYANDLSWEEIFVEPMRNLVDKRDVVIGISGSGSSMNVVKALEYAKSVGATTVAMCGFDGGRIATIADITVCVGIHDMEVVEDVHVAITHCLKRMLIEALGDE